MPSRLARKTLTAISSDNAMLAGIYPPSVNFTVPLNVLFATNAFAPFVLDGRAGER
jgi:hypothetical protein